MSRPVLLQWLLEAEAAISYPLFGSSSELQFGARAEGWFDQSNATFAGGNCGPLPPFNNGCTKVSGGDRREVTPFARLRIKIGD